MVLVILLINCEPTLAFSADNKKEEEKNVIKSEEIINELGRKIKRETIILGNKTTVNYYDENNNLLVTIYRSIDNYEWTEGYEDSEIVPYGYNWSDRGNVNNYNTTPKSYEKINMKLRNTIMNLGIDVLAIIVTAEFKIPQLIAISVAKHLYDLVPNEETLYYEQYIYNHKVNKFINVMRKIRYFSSSSFNWPVSDYITQFGYWSTSF